MHVAQHAVAVAGHPVQVDLRNGAYLRSCTAVGGCGARFEVCAKVCTQQQHEARPHHHHHSGMVALWPGVGGAPEGLHRSTCAPTHGTRGPRALSFEDAASLVHGGRVARKDTWHAGHRFAEDVFYIHLLEDDGVCLWVDGTNGGPLPPVLVVLGRCHAVCLRHGLRAHTRAPQTAAGAGSRCEGQDGPDMLRSRATYLAPLTYSLPPPTPPRPRGVPVWRVKNAAAA